jgi:hypothetical protein
MVLPEILAQVALDLHAIQIEIDCRHSLCEVPSDIPCTNPQTGDTAASILHFDDHGGGQLSIRVTPTLKRRTKTSSSDLSLGVLRNLDSEDIDVMLPLSFFLVKTNGRLLTTSVISVTGHFSNDGNSTAVEIIFLRNHSELRLWTHLNPLLL